MTTKINVPNDWANELRVAVRLAVGESAPWYLTQRQRADIVAQVMQRIGGVLPTGGGGGPIIPLGGDPQT